MFQLIDTRICSLMFLIVAKAVRRRQWRAAAAQDGNNGLPSAYLRPCGEVWGLVFVIPLNPSTTPEIS
jgi:hypothetical protein